MTEKELSQKFNIHIYTFDEQELETEDAFYIADLRTIFISSKIAKENRIPFLLHELGHEEHLPHLYQTHREKYELQANRNMIHHLMKAELAECEDHSTFNYLTFMEKYKLKTMADEALVLEEFKNLVNII